MRHTQTRTIQYILNLLYLTYTQSVFVLDWVKKKMWTNKNQLIVIFHVESIKSSKYGRKMEIIKCSQDSKPKLWQIIYPSMWNWIYMQKHCVLLCANLSYTHWYNGSLRSHSLQFYENDVEPHTVHTFTWLNHNNPHGAQ